MQICRMWDKYRHSFFFIHKLLQQRWRHHAVTPPRDSRPSEPCFFIVYLFLFLTSRDTRKQHLSLRESHLVLIRPPVSPKQYADGVYCGRMAAAALTLLQPSIGEGDARRGATKLTSYKASAEQGRWALTVPIVDTFRAWPSILATLDAKPFQRLTVGKLWTHAGKS